MHLEPLLEALKNELSVKAILCYGSYALGLEDAKSDIDLLVIVEGDLPDVATRRAVYDKIPSLSIDKLDFTADLKGEWDNSWSPLNDRLIFAGKVVEVGYNRASWVDCVIAKLIDQHLVGFAEFPFRPYTFLGLLDYCKVLFDRDGYIERYRQKIHPIPPGLKKAIIEANWPLLLESYEDLKDCDERSIGVLSYAFFLFRILDAASTLLFLINDRYDPASKRVEALLFRLEHLPAGFRKLIEKELPCFYNNRKELREALDELVSYLNRAATPFAGD